MIGHRVEHSGGALPEAGVYWRDGRDGKWYAVTPNGHLAGLANHSVVEHEDGTITDSSVDQGIRDRIRRRHSRHRWRRARALAWVPRARSLAIMLTAYDIRARLGLPLTPFANTAPSWCKDLADDAAALLAHIDAQNAGLLHAVDRHVEREVSREPSCNR